MVKFIVFLEMGVAAHFKKNRLTTFYCSPDYDLKPSFPSSPLFCRRRLQKPHENRV